VELNFDVNLEFNTALKILYLTSYEMSEELATWTELTWLLPILSSINTSNRLEHIKVHLDFGVDNFEQVDCLSWQQIDRILAGAHFKFLQKLEFHLWFLSDIDTGYDGLDSKQVGDLVCMSIVAAFPLLAERGVSVEARPVRI
jgi:hypothetical protein